MLARLSRSLLLHYSCANKINIVTKVIRLSSTESVTFSRSGTEQIEYIKSVIESNDVDWPTLKNNVLSKTGNVNEKNFEGILLKIMTNNKQFDAAMSFANHLKTRNKEMTLGSINGLLGLYYELGTSRKLSQEERVYVLDLYKSLYDKYKILDYATCEKLIRALCVIDEWEKALRVLEDVYQSSVPSHIAFSILIGALFRNNKKKKAFELINQSLEYKRPLKYLAFEEWINYTFRKYKEQETILKYLDEIYLHISRNYAVVDEQTAVKLKTSFESLGWDAKYTKIRKANGQCMACKDTLDRLELSDKEFLSLQQNVKDKLIVGSNLFLKTSPEELKRFLSFVEKTAPYDVVIDSLNVAYSVGKGSSANRISMLFDVVDYFTEQNKRILLLGRKHMLRWGKGSIQRLQSNTCSFFTEDISQDDPYFITAAILSGPKTDIVSKDLLRGHQFLLRDEQLRYLFRRWQWQHQWMVYISANRAMKIQPPLSFTPCAQKNNGTWHLPFERDVQEMGKTRPVNDGTPDLSTWLCIKPRLNKSSEQGKSTKINQLA